MGGEEGGGLWQHIGQEDDGQCRGVEGAAPGEGGGGGIGGAKCAAAPKGGGGG
jgi:hypothetical protein